MLVSTEWLEVHLTDPDLVVVDLRWREDGSGRARYLAGHVPGAAHLDWSTDLVDPTAPLAFTLADPARFARTMEAVGIGDDTLVVAYADARGSGPHRLWWACRRYGHDGVRVLDGGFGAWAAEGRPVSTDPPPQRTATFTPHPDSALQATAADVEAARSGGRAVVIDTRPPEQYRGEAVWYETGAIRADADGVARTPRGEIPAGRIPWAANVPALELYGADGRLRSPDELRALFRSAGVREDGRAITYCGVGISAAAVLFALAYAGYDGALYDGSWEEWSRDPARPITRG